MMSCNRAIALAALLLASISTGATDLTVTRTDDPAPSGCLPNDCSLREAVMFSNALSGANRIILPSGVYQLTISGGGDVIDASVGDLDIDSDIEIVGAGAASTTILGENSARIFTVVGGSSLLLRQLTVDHGRDSSGNGGGAIWQLGKLTVEDAVISDSQTTKDGGAIRNGSIFETVLRRVHLLNNKAIINGGAILAGSFGVLLIDSVVSGNSAINGGAIDGYAIRVYRSLIQNNHASGNGGGIFGEGGCTCTSIEVHDSTIADNGALQGGGIYAVYPFVIEQTTLSANTGNAAGGAIYIDDSASTFGNTTAHVISSTIYPNTAFNAGVYFHDVQASANYTVLFQNTLVSGTCTHGGAGPNYFYGLLGNLESPGNTCGFGGGFPNGNFSTYDVPAADLKLGALADNGGPTPTHLPLAGSAVIGTGWPSVCEKLDQRGYVRADGDCDVGTVEAGALDDVIFRTGNDY